ncbi:antibiotic biosynthesis monooxygenase [Streptosporangium soli]|nr:antibiotic biosynthesis monooxygenase [Streptosporangium sp. KLBMP 9127]
MEVLVAVIAFAGALLAAIATGALIGRFRSEPSGWLGAWSAVTAALCVSLGVVATGHLVGFGPTTFRLYQLTGSLIAPFWLAIGVIQLLARKTPAKFATWLLGGALTFVALVILILDPTSHNDGFSQSLPLGAEHWSTIPSTLLAGTHGVTVLVLIVSLVIAVLRWRDGDDYDADNMHAILVLGPIGIALVGAVRFAVPGVFAAALLTVTAAGVWYTLIRPLAPYDDEEEEEEQEEPRPASRRAAPEQPPRRQVPERVAEPAENRMPPGPPQRPSGQRRSGLGDLVAEYRAGEQDVDYASRMQPRPDDPFEGRRPPLTDDPRRAPLTDDPRRAPLTDDPRRAPQPDNAGRAPLTDDPFEAQGRPPTGEHQAFGMPPNGARGPQHGPGRRSEGRRAGRREPDFVMPGTGTVHPGAEGAGPGGRPSPSIFGLLTVFTLMDGAGDAFDRLAEETVEGVRRNEPDSLIYSCHAVKSAPLQRIIYELYRDEVAYTDHQRQPHVARFVAERQPLVLATNVIELNVNAAKVVPLPTAFPI